MVPGMIILEVTISGAETSNINNFISMLEYHIRNDRDILAITNPLMA